MDFKCVQDCSQCCIEREYYPSKKFGKIGVLVLPDEKNKIEDMAIELGLNVSILPRIGVSTKKSDKPESILAYQMMGKETNGNTCPFLDTKSGKKSPNGGYPCKIYENRPLACKAYPLIETNPIMLDSKCKFCQDCGSADKNLDSEMEALIKIKSKMKTDHTQIWRYATAVGEESDKGQFSNGWIKE